MISVRIQEKLYIVYMCIVEISPDGCYFHQQNNDRIKANEDLDFCFCDGSEKSRFEWLHKNSVILVTSDFSKYPIFRTNFRFPCRFEKSGFNRNFGMIIRLLGVRIVNVFVFTAI